MKLRIRYGWPYRYECVSAFSQFAVGAVITFGGIGIALVSGIYLASGGPLPSWA
jgi:hypothetical protein